MENQKSFLKRIPKSVQFLIYLGFAYVVFFTINFFTSESTEFITDNWEVSSKSDILLFTLLQVFTIVLFAGAAVFAVKLCMVVLRAKRPFLYFGLFIILFCFAVAIIFFVVVPNDEWLEFIHVPILAFLMACFAAFMIFASEKQRKKGKPKS